MEAASWSVLVRGLHRPTVRPHTTVPHLYASGVRVLQRRILWLALDLLPVLSAHHQRCASSLHAQHLAPHPALSIIANPHT
jgi:hypothetical protein